MREKEDDYYQQIEDYSTKSTNGNLSLEYQL